jgi:hypothetical protein
VADISYTPTFHHIAWLDRVDRVEAAGPNGFNSRFNAIESDLRQVSTVVTQISDEMATIGTPPQTPPPTGEQRLRLTPVLKEVLGQWEYDTFGETSLIMSPDVNISLAVMNVELPQGARLKSLTARFEFAPPVNVNIVFRVSLSLSRLPLRLTVPPTQQDFLASAGFTGRQQLGVFDFSADINPSLGEVDQDNFRYFLTADAGTQVGLSNGFTIKFRAVQITYSFD